MKNDEFFSPVERAIRKAMADGLFDNLPGMGKPLSWANEDPNTPEDKRMAYKILREHNLAPEWMMHGQALEGKREEILKQLKRGVRAYLGALHDADRKGDLGMRSRAHQTWERLEGTFNEAGEIYNHHVMVYNLKAPPGIEKKKFLDIGREIEQLMQ